MRIVRYVFLVIVLVAIIGVVALHMYTVAETKRAGIFKERVLALKPGKSTLGDVRALVAQYGNAGDYEGPCDEKECQVSMAPSSFAIRHPRFDVKLLRFFGIRPADYGVFIRAENEVVTRVDFYVFYRKADGSWVRAGTLVIDNFGNEDRCANSGVRRHSEYAVAAGENKKHPGQFHIDAGVTLKASTEEYRHAQTLNLSCVNSLRDCSLSDLMPLAHSDWLEDLKWAQEHNEQLLQEKLQCKQQLASGLIGKQRWVTGLGDD